MFALGSEEGFATLVDQRHWSSFDMLSTGQQHTPTHNFIAQSIPKLLLGIVFITAMEHKLEL